MSSDAAIRIQGLGKCYHIYNNPRDRLLQGLWRGRRKYFRDFWALRDVSFEVQTGETLGIIGRNGSGKSTLLQILCSTLTPTTGTLEVKGRVAALLELGAGFNPDFSGRENIYLNAAILGLTQEEIEQRYESIVAFADIGAYIDQPVKTYSSGMYMRVAFAVIAHVNADILVIDEALAVGDAFFTQKCMRFLRGFRERGTILFVSHDTGAVINLCHRAIWLDKGTMRMTGTAKAVCEAYLAAFTEELQGGPLTGAPVVAEGARADSAGNGGGQVPIAAGASLPGPLRDQRLDILNSSPFRNDIEVFQFDPNTASFGKGGAKIINVAILNDRGEQLSWVVGGELVVLLVQVQSLADLHGPIIGFYVKDRLGQTLFGDNTYINYAKNPLVVKKGQNLEARFRFSMPVLAVGTYSICAAVAEGVQTNHVQHHWIHDALLVESHTTSVSTGLMGIPMLDVQLRALQ
jgi:lipopolysaccharide transport system ATP-binding protein